MLDSDKSPRTGASTSRAAFPLLPLSLTIGRAASANFQIFANLICGTWDLGAVLKCISLIISEVNMFSYIGGNTFLFPPNCFCPFPTGLWNVFLSVFTSSLYISDINPLQHNLLWCYFSVLLILPYRFRFFSGRQMYQFCPPPHPHPRFLLNSESVKKLSLSQVNKN